jgi:uncharacterized RDD family membrane protein YckC
MNFMMFAKRAVAVIIDVIILGIVCNVIGPLGGLAWMVYEVCLLTLWNGQTIGKKILGIRVTPQPDWGKAIVRTVMKIISSIPLGLGYFWMLWDKKGQTWHDKVAETIVK